MASWTDENFSMVTWNIPRGAVLYTNKRICIIDQGSLCYSLHPSPALLSSHGCTAQTLVNTQMRSDRILRPLHANTKEFLLTDSCQSNESHCCQVCFLQLCSVILLFVHILSRMSYQYFLLLCSTRCSDKSLWITEVLILKKSKFWSSL